MADDEREPDPLEHFKRVAAEWKDPFRAVAELAIWARDNIDKVHEQDRARVRSAAEQLLQRVIAIQYAESIPSLRMGDAGVRLELARLHQQCHSLRIAFELMPLTRMQLKQQESLIEINTIASAKHDRWRELDAALPEQWRGRPKSERAAKIRHDNDIEEKPETIAKQLPSRK